VAASLRPAYWLQESNRDWEALRNALLTDIEDTEKMTPRAVQACSFDPI